MSGGEQFTITQDDEVRLKQEDEEIERKIADLRERQELVQQSLKAIGVLKTLKGVKLDASAHLIGSAVLTATAEVSRAEGDEPLTAAIMRIIGKSKSGMYPQEIRRTLITEGIPEERLGNYFYSAISRLKSRKLLSVSRKRYRIVQKPETPDEDQSSEASKRERPNQPLNHQPMLEGR